MTVPADRGDRLDARRKREHLARLLAARQRTAREYPLSFSQRRLWFLNQLSPGSPFYNVDATLPMHGPVDAAALERAINAIVERHESLRTTFRSQDGEPVQVVAPQLTIELRRIDLRGLAAPALDTRIAELRQREAQEPYDLERGPLLRTVLVRVSEEEHLFVLGMHHIVCDGWSMGVFGRELQEFYTGFATGVTPTLPELPIQYGDFAAWQRRWLSGERLESELTFWRRTLEGVAPLELWTDFARPPVQRYRGSHVNVHLGRELTDRVHALSRQEPVTLFITLLAAFNVLLHRYSGQDDIAVGTYIANRTRRETEPLIGFFLNTLVLRTDSAGDPTFREYLSRVKTTAVDAYSHQDLPFETLVEHLHPIRDLSRNPLFQVTFQLSNAPTQQMADDVSWLLDSKRGATIFDLAFMLFKTSQGLAGQFEYSTDLFRESTVAAMARHYRAILEAVTENPELRLSEIPLITEDERHQLLIEWNRTGHELPSGQTVVQLFEEQAARKGTQTALSCGAASLTLAAVRDRANRIAGLLRDAGVTPGTAVGVCIPRSLNLVPALLGIWKTGAVYVPLDPAYPAGRLNYMVEDSGARFVLTEAATAGHVAAPQARMLTLPDLSLPAPPVEPHDVLASAEDAAYIIYSSGSTGPPKGVVVPFRQILNRLHWMWETYPFEVWDVSVSKTAISFVDSLWELLGPLLRGSPTVIIPDQTVRDPRLLVAELAAQQATSIWIVPSLLATVLDAVPALGEALPALRFWVSSGETLPGSLLERFRAAHPTATLFNLYGTSEVWDATWFDSYELTSVPATVPIGRPIWNVQTFVLDRHLRPQPVGVPGELFVAGAGLASGYVGDPARTAERFVELPFVTDSRRAYRTGDRARWLPGGDLEILGRLDDQIKIRGFRVEPSEIEAALLAFTGVRHAGVLADASGSGLTAWVASGSDPLPDASDLRSFLRTRLPAPIVPARIHVTAALPLTPSGKVDRRALAAQATVRPIRARGRAPGEGVEGQIAHVWREVLGLEEVDADANFFDLGGHSLLATQVISRLRKALRMEIPVQVLFEEPTVAALAQWVARSGPAAPASVPAITRVARDKYVVSGEPAGPR